VTKKPLNYKDAGVDINAGNQLVENIKPLTRKTHRDGVLSSLGGFGALFELPTNRYKNPVLVSGTDGVGTKLKLAQELGIYNTIGIDLVAMCVNDIIVTGAEPLYFLDYYACGKLDTDIATDVISGIAAGCEQAGAALTGGETAEMPGMYQEGDFDLAGFCVGVVEKSEIIDGSNVKEGDALIGLSSSGPHSNGYSLIRKIVSVVNADLHQPFNNTTLGEVLLTPTQIYVKPLLDIHQKYSVKSLAHITGGGLLENIPRVLPNGLNAQIDATSWQMPEIFSWLAKNGNIETSEMYRTFNCGIGMVLCVAQNDCDDIINSLSLSGQNAFYIGQIVKSDSSTPQVLI